MKNICHQTETKSNADEINDFTNPRRLIKSDLLSDSAETLRSPFLTEWSRVTKSSVKSGRSKIQQSFFSGRMVKSFETVNEDRVV